VYLDGMLIYTQISLLRNCWAFLFDLDIFPFFHQDDQIL
jgi:hypothetical protein